LEIFIKMNNQLEIDLDFTVLMPTYNRQDLCDLFEYAIDSVLENSVLPEKIIVVVDGPVSQVFEEKIRRYEKAKKINVLWLKKNVGLTKALNIGLNNVTTTWVLRADGDDFNLPDRFAKQIEYMRKGYDLIGGAIREVDRDGKELALRRVPTEQSEILSFMARRCPFNHMTVAFRTELVRKCGGYPDVYLKEDYALWALMIKNGAKVANSPEILVNETTGADMYGRRGGLKYVISEYHLQCHLIECGLKGVWAAFFHGISRALVFLMPSYLRSKIYVKFLRN